MLKKKLFSGFTILVFMTMALFAVNAEDAAPPPNENIAESWTMTPKAGMANEFETALKAHMDFRASKADPRQWDTYTPYVGDDLGFYVVRSCCASWAAIDGYSQWQNDAGTQAHWNANVDQYVASYAHAFFAVDMENSNWKSNPDYRFVGVTNFKPKRGSSEALNSAIKQMSTHAKEGGWPRSWAWTWQIGGNGGLSLASPMMSLAEMQQDQPFSKFLAEKMRSEKKAKALLKEYNEQFEESSYTIYAHRKSLSMAMEAE